MKGPCILLLLATVLVTPAVAQQRKTATRPLSLVLHHMVGNDSLVLGNAYVNAVGDTMSIYKFRYYLSNFSVTGKDGNIIKLPQQYFLVDESDPATKAISLAVPAQVEITGIGFLLGVDSVRNVSGVQEGALDPGKGMFWTWNSGYIMAKLEGSSPAAHVAGNIFTFHVGGFRSPVKTMKAIMLPVNGSTSQLNLIADINSWFRGASELHIGETPVCHSPGRLAARIADNYAGMFSIKPLP